jgi:hypothetical protein
VIVKEIVSINQLNYKAPEKSDGTEELVGYTNEELAEMHFVCGVCCSGKLTDATVHRQRRYPASGRLHSNRYQSVCNGPTNALVCNKT